MLNGEGNENNIKISKKTDCTCNTLFFLISAARFLSFFAVFLHTYNAV